MLPTISIPLVLLPLLLHLHPGQSGHHPDQLRMMLPYSGAEEWIASPQLEEAVGMDRLTQRQTRSGRYKGQTGLADRGGVVDLLHVVHTLLFNYDFRNDDGSGEKGNSR